MLTHSPDLTMRFCRAPGAGDAQTVRRGVAAVQVAIGLPMLLTFAALTVDIGRLYVAENELQVAADSAAMAGVSRLPNQTSARQTANQFATLNGAHHPNLIKESDIALGNWNTAAALFLENAPPLNAVRVTTRRAQANQNPLPLLFAPVFGVTETEASATAVAYLPAGMGFRFLIDDEMFDTDEPAIEALATSLGRTPDELLRDGNNDLFIDIPAGHVLTLPTGQVGDEGLFEIGEEFDWTDDSDPSYMDLLLYRIPNNNYRGISDSQLDPLIGVEPLSNPSAYPSLVDPNFIHVSPLYKSDVSDTTPGVNAKGERRGLVAFKILAVSADPPGSELPFMTIQIMGPVDLNQVALGENSTRIQLVQ